jgi:hypothetical protein
MRALPLRNPLTIATLVCSLVGPVGAQDEGDPGGAVDETALAELFGSVDLARTSTPLLPEGTFLSAREGRLLVTEGGDRVLGLNPDQTDRRARAMIVLPNIELERIERAARESGVDEPRFRITGQVFVYHRHNYVLVSAWTQVVRNERDGAGESERAAEAGDDGNRAGRDARERDSGGDEVTTLIQELEQSREEPGAALAGDRSPVWLPPREDRDAGEGSLIPDGTLLQSQRARLVRQGVSWTIAFDNGPESRSVDPLVVLPCLHHERLERLTQTGGDEIEIDISGRVFVFRGRNYILPTLFQVISGREIDPIQ